MEKTNRQSTATGLVIEVRPVYDGLVEVTNRWDITTDEVDAQGHYIANPQRDRVSSISSLGILFRSILAKYPGLKSLHVTMGDHPCEQVADMMERSMWQRDDLLTALRNLSDLIPAVPISNELFVAQQAARDILEKADAYLEAKQH